MSETVFVTGANGFVGRNLVHSLKQFGFSVVPIVRNASVPGEVSIGDVDRQTDWRKVLLPNALVVHCAARAHILSDRRGLNSSIYDEVNYRATEKLATDCAEIGIRRFIFLSSIKVHGEQNFHGVPFRHDDILLPRDPYGMSKERAENAIREISSSLGLDYTILRPPLVYGTGVGANFLRLIKWVEKGVPLPFGLINNRRSIIGIRNLINVIQHCLFSPNASKGTFLVADPTPVSTPELIRLIAESRNITHRLVNIPTRMLDNLARFLGKRDDFIRLTGDLYYDTAVSYELLKWVPPFSTLEELKHMYRQQIGRSF